MKSKSFNLKQKSHEKVKLNKTFDFTSYYKTAAETSEALENTKDSGNVSKVYLKGERSVNKNKNRLEPLDISTIDIIGPNLNTSIAKSTPLNESRVTSTPQASNKSQGHKVKSIMKNSSGQSEDLIDESQYYTSPGKPKKRNKSVSFMLEDAEDVIIKKTKSNDSIEKKPTSTKKTDVSKEKIKKNQKLKKDLSEKENKGGTYINVDSANTSKLKLEVKTVDKKSITDGDISKITTPNNIQTEVTSLNGNAMKSNPLKKRKLKKFKKQNSEETSETGAETNNNENQIENKQKKLKKKKKIAKLHQNVETDADGEPASKTRKTEVKPEAIVDNLESLSIGDNAHTLTNLLDVMTVAEKDKRTKNKRKVKKDKKQAASSSSSDNTDLEKIEEGKEKIKWNKRKWNKDKKAEVDGDGLPTSIIIDNLPISIMCIYKKILSEQFGKYGIIKKIGIAEMYPTEVSKPVFTTTINFYSDGAATKALEEDNTLVEGSHIHVRQPLQPTQTTLVVRSYAELTEQALSSTFVSAGKIRSIKHLVKGKKVIATAFIEFDGPEAVEKALKIGKEVKLGGKKLHVSKFEVRKKAKKPSVNSENEGDSEDSNK